MKTQPLPSPLDSVSRKSFGGCFAIAAVAAIGLGSLLYQIVTAL